MHTRITAEQIQTFQGEKKARFKRLTEQSQQGSFQAFQERQKMLSRDPVDLGMEWQQFQKGG